MNSELPELLRFLTPRERAELDLLLQGTSTWRPLPGPQTLAYHSNADVLFYGGAAGGGKTDLLLGLARHEHQRSIVFRRVYPSLGGIIERSRAMYAPDGTASRAAYNESLHRWKFSDGRTIRFGSIQHEHDVKDWQGQAHDYYGFDELPEFTESQFRFVTGWNRTTRPGQRCRIVATGNPPTDSDGEWVIRFFAPWLDLDHPRPAKPGELRWFTTIGGKDVEVEQGWSGIDEQGNVIVPRSRTFIPARVQDNPYLLDSGYIATLQGLPEPLRSKMLFGDFSAGREDSAYQVIPSEWVRLAQARWKPNAGVRMSALGVDVARGGKDKTILAPRHANWFAELLAFPGSSTPDGPVVAALVVKHRCDDAVVNIDVIGVGSSPYDCLRAALGEKAVAMNGAEGSEKTDKSGQLGFVNQRAEWYWGLREALDPASGQDLALPPDPELKADLCAPRWKLTARGIQIESKDDLQKRIGRSPDRGDAVVYAHAIKTMPGMGVFEFMRQQAEAAKAAKERTP